MGGQRSMRSNTRKPPPGLERALAILSQTETLQPTEEDGGWMRAFRPAQETEGSKEFPSDPTSRSDLARENQREIPIWA
jgi:hypothetical protein